MVEREGLIPVLTRQLVGGCLKLIEDIKDFCNENGIQEDMEVHAYINIRKEDLELFNYTEIRGLYKELKALFISLIEKKINGKKWTSLIACAWGEENVEIKKQDLMQTIKIDPEVSYIYTREKMFIIEKLRDGKIDELIGYFSSLKQEEKIEMYANLIIELIPSKFAKEIEKFNAIGNGEKCNPIQSIYNVLSK